MLCCRGAGALLVPQCRCTHRWPSSSSSSCSCCSRPGRSDRCCSVCCCWLPACRAAAVERMLAPCLRHIVQPGGVSGVSCSGAALNQRSGLLLVYSPQTPHCIHRQACSAAPSQQTQSAASGAGTARRHPRCSKTARAARRMATCGPATRSWSGCRGETAYLVALLMECAL